MAIRKRPVLAKEAPPKGLHTPDPGDARSEAATWFDTLTDRQKEGYLRDHPNSKYAQDYKRKTEKVGTKEPEDQHGTKSTEHPEAKTSMESKGKPTEVKELADEAGESSVSHKPKSKPKYDTEDETRKVHPEDKENVLKEQPFEHGDLSKPMSEDQVKKELHKKVTPEDLEKALKNPQLKDKKFRHKIGGLVKKKSKGILHHLKHEAKEWHVASKSIHKILTRKPLDEHDKEALKSVATDIAVIATMTIAGGGLAHGVAALMKHVGTHFIQEAFIKSTAKGILSHNQQRGGMLYPSAWVQVTAANDSEGQSESEVDKFVEQLVQKLADFYASGDFSKYMDQQGQD